MVRGALRGGFRLAFQNADLSRRPDVPGIFLNRAVARKFSGRGDVQDGLPRPAFLVRVKLAQPPMRFTVTLQVRQVQAPGGIREYEIIDVRYE